MFARGYNSNQASTCHATSPGSCRKVSASTFNAAIDVREDQPRFAEGLLRASGSCCVLVATRCVLAGEPAALHQLARDSVKRCMLGFRTASDSHGQEHFISTGLLILSLVYQAAEVSSVHAVIEVTSRSGACVTCGFSPFATFSVVRKATSAVVHGDKPVNRDTSSAPE